MKHVIMWLMCMYLCLYRIRAEPITAKSFQDESISYEVLDQQNNPSTFFQINSDRKLYALQQLDYENAAHRQFSLTIRATESITNYISSVNVRSFSLAKNLNHVVRKLSLGFWTRSDTNQAMQP